MHRMQLAYFVRKQCVYIVFLEHSRMMEITFFLSYSGKHYGVNEALNLSFNSAYHPQIHGRTELVNSSLGNFLRCLASERPNRQDLVLSLLQQAQFAYNSSINKTTSKSPFEILYDYPISITLTDLLYLTTYHEHHSIDADTNIEHIRKVQGVVVEKLRTSNTKYK